MKTTVGVWQKESKNPQSAGMKYYYGNRDGVKVSVFKNQNKRGPSDPDLNVIVEIEGAAQPGDSGGSGRSNSGLADDEIPF